MNISHVYYRIFLFIILFLACIHVEHAISETIKWDCSAVVYINNNIVKAEDRDGRVVMEGNVGQADADVIQAAIDAVLPAGEIKICRGKYILNKPIQIYHNIKLTGEGRSTIIVPPKEDFAFWFDKKDTVLISRPYHKKEGFPLYAMIMSNMTIDGERENIPHSGKGLFLGRFWSSVFQNLWIQNTGTAIQIESVHESEFSNIYLINNGDEIKKEPSILMKGSDNLHFRSLYVIYPNYIGLEIILNSKLVFITQSMFHGWLPRHGGAAKYPLIQIKDLNKKKEGRYKSDVIIENSRITVGGEGSCAVNIINSPVKLRQCVATAGEGNTVVRVSDNARVNITDNSFYSFLPLPSGKYVLYAEDSEVIFKNNVISFQNLQLCLKAARNSIIADNRFDAISENPNVFIGNNEDQYSRNIQVRGNIFRKENIKDAVEKSPHPHKNITIYDNQLWSE
ncbi:hypothetical protein JXQ31_02280 [candidate division KSB1 bacterium]|nr:hypothetical protein [candidate division KSB1 bacterium]